MIFSEAADAYRRTRKPKDILWNRLVARPLAALFVVPLARTAVTPNQITFLTLVMFVAGALVLVLCPGWGALVAAAPARPSFSPLRALESLGRFLVHYPSYILFVALANRIDLFLHVYIAVNAAYAGRALLGVAVKLGRRA